MATRLEQPGKKQAEEQLKHSGLRCGESTAVYFGGAGNRSEPWRGGGACDSPMLRALQPILQQRDACAAF